MRLEEIMQQTVITVSPESTIAEALQLLREHRIRHLPVVEGERLLGIISDRDVGQALPSSLLPSSEESMLLQTPVRKIMNEPVIVAHPLDFIDDAASLIYEHKISALPLVDGDRLVGIVTSTDLLHSMIELFGVAKPSSVIELEVSDLAGSLAEVSRFFQTEKVEVISVIVNPGTTAATKKLVFRVRTIDPRKVRQQLTANGFDVLEPGRGGVLP